jgi:hypothetical protein
MTQLSVPEQLARPSALGEEARASVADTLNPLVADAFALYVKTKNYHWHMSGPHFRDYHLLLDEQAPPIPVSAAPCFWCAGHAAVGAATALIRCRRGGAGPREP